MRFALLTLVCTALPCAIAAAPAAAQTTFDPVPLSLAAPEAALSAPALGSSDSLPDSPGSALAESPVLLADPFGGVGGQAPTAQLPTHTPVAKKYASIILPGQTAVPLTGGEKFTYSVLDSISPFTLFGCVISGTYSQAVDSQPNYGQGWGPYGQRVGAAVARSTVQNIASEGILDPLFHDDPRYYMKGYGHRFINRAVYAATRVLIVRSDAGTNRINAPLLLGYVGASGVNFAYYPQRNRNFHDAAIGYAGSIGGAALGFEVSEFLDDALQMVHLRKNSH